MQDYRLCVVVTMCVLQEVVDLSRYLEVYMKETVLYVFNLSNCVYIRELVDLHNFLQAP